MVKLKVRIKKLHPWVEIPKYATDGAACFDLEITDITRDTENRVVVKYGFSMEIPVGYKLIIVPRSGFTHKGWVLQNSPCQIDSDYRGEIMSKFEAIPTEIMEETGSAQLLYDAFPYKNGDCVTQAYLEEVIQAEFEEAEELSETLRGEGGFGSTDKKEEEDTTPMPESKL